MRVAGFTDTLSGVWGRELSDSAHLLQSPFAAMPSGHVAFALVAGATFARLGDMAWLRAFGWLYPGLVVAITVVTAHHLFVDAFAATALVACAYGAARLNERPRRRGAARSTRYNGAPCASLRPRR